jgi:hypothetical protein
MKSFFKKKYLFFLISVCFFTFIFLFFANIEGINLTNSPDDSIAIVFAQGPGGGGGGARGGDEPPQFSIVWDILNRGAGFFIGFIVIAAVAMVIYGGYVWMGSAGDPDRVKSAQGILTWAILGLVFFLIISLVFRFVLGLFGIEGFTIFEF